ncbi:MAG: PAS domain S-box protein [Alphaproteobacteria bacterium]
MREERGGELPLMDEDRYRLLVESIVDYSIFMLDPEGIVASWNAGARSLKGYEASEIVGRHFRCFYPEPDRLAWKPEQALQTAAREGRFETDGWRLRKDGTRFWAHVVIDPVRDAAGMLVGYAKITRDLTERKRAEDRLRRSEEQLRLLVQGVTDYAIFLLDIEGNVTNWNAGAERIKGYRPDEIVGRHFSTFYTEEDRRRGEPQRALETAMREGRFESDGWRVRKDGTRFRANVVIDAIRADDGTIVAFAKVTRDVTERIEARRALEEAHGALVQSQKLDALGQLTGGIAHDFNNLLMAVLGNLELLRRRMKPDPRLDRLVGNAAQAAERGVALTRRMLAFARRQDLDVHTIRLPPLVAGMRELLERSLGPGIALETRFPKRLPPVEADPNQLELAILNLALNSRDAMPEGGTILVSGRVLAVPEGNELGLAGGEHVCLSVADTGEGMDEATLARAIEPFFTTKGVGKGTGLGLSMVHGMAAQLGGRFVLASRRGEGTIAEIWLPAASSDPDAATERTATPGAAPGPSLVVLLVDDDGAVLEGTQLMLEELGHKVVAAASGADALQAARSLERIDLVVTDFSMPHMTGLRLVEALEEMRPGLPVVLMTGYADLPGDPPVPWVRLAKPFTMNQLAAAMRASGDRGGPR